MRKTKMQLIKKFEKRDNWDCFCYFYEVWEDSRKRKHLSINYKSNTISDGEGKTVWIIEWFYRDNKCSFDELLEWRDYFHVIEKITQKHMIDEYYYEPLKAYEKVNELLTEDGRRWLNFNQITEDTPCGLYVGRK